jgi:hypothetical protein
MLATLIGRIDVEKKQMKTGALLEISYIIVTNSCDHVTNTYAYEAKLSL